MYLFASGLSQVPIKVTQKHTTDITIMTAQFVLKARFDGAAERRSAMRQAI
jgi:hypothetical protein